MKFRVARPTVSQIVCLAFVSFIFLSLLYMLLSSTKESVSAKKVPQLPTTVSAFWAEYFSDEFEFYTEGNAFYKYFKSLEGLTPAEAGEWDISPEEEDFSQVTESMLEDGIKAVDHYDITPVSNNFCIIKMYFADGTPINPPVGFWFKLTADGKKFEDYCLARLLPYSRYDEEYSEDWNDIK